MASRAILFVAGTSLFLGITCALSAQQGTRTWQPRQLGTPQLRFQLPGQSSQTRSGISSRYPQNHSGAAKPPRPAGRAAAVGENPWVKLMEGLQQWTPPQGPNVQWQFDAGRAPPARTQESRSGGSYGVTKSGFALAIPTEEQAIRFSSSELQSQALAAVGDLRRGLSRITTRDTWLQHLQIDELQRGLAAQDGNDSNALSHEQFRRIADRYETISGDKKYQKISSMRGFRALQVLLPELSAKPAERWSRRLTGDVQSFDEQLSRTHNGSSWKNYLRLDELAAMDTKQLASSADDAEVLKAIKQRFDDTARNDKYKVIARLSGFRQTRDTLEELVKRTLAEADRKKAQAAMGVVRLSQSKSPDPTSADGTLILADKTRDPDDTFGIKRLGKPEEVMVLPLSDDEPKPQEVMIMPLSNSVQDKEKSEKAAIMPLRDPAKNEDDGKAAEGDSENEDP